MRLTASRRPALDPDFVVFGGGGGLGQLLVNEPPKELRSSESFPD